MRQLRTTDPDFNAQLQALFAYEPGESPEILSRTQAIVSDVRQRGDAAVLEYTERFDQVNASSLSELEVSPAEIEAAVASLPDSFMQALETAASRIHRFHEKQRAQSWTITEDNGNRLGQQVTALGKAGIYVPGGKASYPSSVLMNAIPAKVAGVGEIIMVVPAPKGELNPAVLAAAHIAGVDRIFKIGGAQAVAALAYGTQTVPGVDKIVGPGNIYVATAKRLVFGQVGIDMIAGPSEILVVADGTVPADWIAMDLFSQAEHDEDAQSILISTNADYTSEVLESIERLLKSQPRADIIRASLDNRGAVIQVQHIDEAIALINEIAPEHLELAFEGAAERVPEITNAGAIFVGPYTAEAFGDYCAGPNHVLPTARTARFSSPLGVYDFQKRSSVIELSAQGAKALAPTVKALTEAESLIAHQQSALYRS